MHKQVPLQAKLEIWQGHIMKGKKKKKKKATFLHSDESK